MEAVLDSTTINHLLRPPKDRRPATRATVGTNLDPWISNKKLVVIVDTSKGLISEWERSSKPEQVRALVVHWQGLGGLRPVVPAPTLGPVMARQLKALGFNKPMDKLILRIAIVTADKNVVTDDGEFWNPADRDYLGNDNAPVARLCRDRLGITLWVLGQFVIRLRRA